MKRLLPRSLVLLILVVTTGCGGGEAPPAATAVATPVPTTAATETVVSPTATSAALAAPVAAAEILVVFDLDTVGAGETVDAVVSVAGVEDLFGLELHLAYDAERLEVVDADPEVEGAQIAHGPFLAIEYVLANQSNAAQGLIDYAVSQNVPSTGVRGTGEIARITFRATSAGLAELRVLSVLLASSAGKSLPVTLPATANVVTVE